MKFAVIDNNENSMDPGRDRGEGFVKALEGWTLGKDYEFVRYERIEELRSELMNCRGLILSGSAFDLADSHGRFDRGTYVKMIQEFRLVRDFAGPVLGICFGHQFLSVVDDFDAGRTGFGGLLVRNMEVPQDDHRVIEMTLQTLLRFTNRKKLWGQFHHKQEVVDNDALRSLWEVNASAGSCRVAIMQHRKRDWFGVQFHPEVGKPTGGGAAGRHQDAVEDGRDLMQDFVKFCLR